VIFAEPSAVASSISLKEIAAISNFFNEPANRIKIQFPSPETKYAWQNMYKFYQTAPIARGGQVSELPYNIHSDIGEVSFTNSKKETETVYKRW